MHCIRRLFVDKEVRKKMKKVFGIGAAVEVGTTE